MIAALAALAEYKQFILWKTTQGKKRPVDPRTLQTADAHNPDAWITYDEAQALAGQHGLGVGFVFTKNDPFFFVDIDKCLDPSNQWSALAQKVLAYFPGAAVEVSQSGRGLHIIARGSAGPHACKNVPLGLELYTSGRFVALTERNIIGDAGGDHSAALAKLIADYFPPKTANAEEWRDVAVDEWDGPELDAQIVAIALRAKSAGSLFSNRASFKDLYECNEEALAKAYPDPEGERAFDGSSADAALAQHLAFYTGKNHERIKRIMESSKLVRDKWDREDYLPRTITRAVNLQKEVFAQRKAKPIAEQLEAAPANVETVKIYSEGLEPVVRPDGSQFIDWAGLKKLFAGCVYIQELHRIFTPTGDILKPEQFKATFGGYEFPMDAENAKPTRNAWEAFTENRGMQFPKVQGCTFRPDLPAGSVIEIEGRKMLNNYIPVETPRKAGDPSPFLDHLAKLYPIPGDVEILLAWMAALIQHKGVKFQWCPLLQGVEGNGKTFFTRALVAAVGDKYSHLPTARDLDNNFNSWQENKIFIGVEDIFVGEDRNGVLEALKPAITSEVLEITRKGVDQVTRRVCGNWMLNSNHKDAIRKAKNDRRFCILYSAQQEDSDLIRDGLTAEYFADLYDWARNRDGFAIVHDFLATYTIPDALNPALGIRAPISSSTDEAIQLSRGSVEDEIVEAIETQAPGFAGGWISSVALDHLLERIRADRKIPRNKRRQLLKSLGYDYHPGLKDGRVNNPMADGTRPRLYVAFGHESAGISKPCEIRRAFEAAQPVPGSSGTAAEVFAT